MPPAVAEALEDVSIVALDARGEGVADNGSAVAGALPGERARVRRFGKRAELVEILSANPDRAQAICRWYGRCGGCAAQHMSQGLYREWKRGLVVEALRREGIEGQVGELVDAHGAGRRRATFHARFPQGAPEEVGFMRARSHEIVSIDDCPLFSPTMAGAIPAARALARDLRGLGKPLDIGVAATLEGLDVDIRGAGPLGLAEIRKLARTAEALDLARLSNHGAAIVERRPPCAAFGGTLVKLPPGGFLQATEAGEERLANFAEEALVASRRMADLFCGAGAFAFRLARAREVLAADIDPDAILALKRAATAQGFNRLTVDARDLYRRPLSAAELSSFDAVLMDPPRAGAREQARELALSALPLVVSISCDPASFARDARAIIEGGFRIERLIPLDQFRFSPHVEIAAVFRRPRTKKRARRLL